jgi:putative transposase
LDVKKRFSEEQIIGFLREAERGVAVKDLCRRHGFSEGSYYLWRSKFGGMDVSDAKRLKGSMFLKQPLNFWLAKKVPFPRQWVQERPKNTLVIGR